MSNSLSFIQQILIICNGPGARLGFGHILVTKIDLGTMRKENEKGFRASGRELGMKTKIYISYNTV